MRRWTVEQRLKQSQIIREKKPWLYSTGPKTAVGKAISSKNSYKHGMRCAEIRNTSRLITKCKRELSQIIKFV